MRGSGHFAGTLSGLEQAIIILHLLAPECAVVCVQVLIQLKADLQQLLEKAAAAEQFAAHSSVSISSGGQSNDSSAAASSSDSSSTPGAEQADSHQEAPAASSRPVLDGDHPFANVAIWQLPVMPLFFEADRTAAKQLAKDLMAALKV
jgi:hypothetical protein